MTPSRPTIQLSKILFFLHIFAFKVPAFKLRPTELDILVLVPIRQEELGAVSG